MHRLNRLVVSLVVFTAVAFPAAAQESSSWTRHTIDASSKGADGIRIADVNHDGHPDLVTGWEEGGQIRVVVNPGPANATKPWKSILVGKVGKPEDAVFADLDQDGAIDVVSSCEGKVRQVYFHWAPKSASDYLKKERWHTQSLPAAKNKTMWMFCLPLQVDQRHGIDLVCGAKGQDAAIGWFESPKDARQLDQWKWHSIYKAGWIMSLYSRDVDGDGDLDIITTDRRPNQQGCHWLENPGTESSGSLARQKQPWKVHTINGGHEAMFATLADLDQDGMEDIITCAKKPERIFFYRRTQMNPPKWETHVINWPANTKDQSKLPRVGGAKALEVGDVDLDGHNDLVCTCESAAGVHGTFWLSFNTSPQDAEWKFHQISGTKKGIKFDIVRLIDLDRDGDLDAVTCEERDNLGVFWYENPTR